MSHVDFDAGLDPITNLPPALILGPRRGTERGSKGPSCQGRRPPASHLPRPGCGAYVWPCGGVFSGDRHPGLCGEGLCFPPAPLPTGVLVTQPCLLRASRPRPAWDTPDLMEEVDVAIPTWAGPVPPGHMAGLDHGSRRRS